ncbi:hypothetical protein [Citricoccus alkalitolerans]|uniref:Uncharacterized protein n=1 Tax=Citricoccus alkalitolerans TaxID=246603 RepID=A0ABV8XXT2_9MICC
MNHDEQLPSGWTSSGIPGSDVLVPPGWTVAATPSADPLATIYAPAESDDGLRPTLVIRRGPTGGASLAAVSAQGMTTMLVSWPGSHLVSNDAMEIQGFEVRAQRYLVDGPGRSAVVERWLVLTGATVVELTGTVPVSRFLEVMPDIETMIMNGTYADAPPSAPEPPPGTYGEPRIDEQFSETVGHRLEAVDALRRDQPLAVRGAAVSESALDLLQGAASTGCLGSLAEEQWPEEVAMLRSQGLLEDRTLSAEATRLLEPVTDQYAYLRVSASHRQRESHLHLWLGHGGSALAAVGAPIQHLVTLDAEDHHRLRDVLVLDATAAEEVPGVIARWMGLGPTWPVTSTSHELTADELEDRLATGPRTGADPSASLAARWADSEWVMITIEEVGVGDGPNITLLHAEGAGYAQPTPVDGDWTDVADATRLRFVPLAPRQVWDVVVGIVDHLVTAG